MIISDTLQPQGARRIRGNKAQILAKEIDQQAVILLNPETDFEVQWIVDNGDRLTGKVFDFSTCEKYSDGKAGFIPAITLISR